MSRDHMFGVIIAVVLIAFVAEIGFFINQAKADVVIVLGPGGTQEGTIITFPSPQPIR